MRVKRLSLLLFALLVSVLVVPEAFGGKGGGGMGGNGKRLPGGKSAEYCDYYIYCYYTPITACCYGSFWDCYDECLRLCGGPCDYAT